MLCIFRNSERKVSKEIPESLRVEFKKKRFSTQSCFIRCETQHKKTKANLDLLRKLLAIHQKSRQWGY